MSFEPARESRLSLGLALVFVTVWVAILVAPIFAQPQLDADDYRYFDLVRQLRAGEISWLSASIIENRWDHLWWIDTEQAVRFFRPTLLTSYFVDDLVHGSSFVGMFATNALLYWATCALATVLLFRLIAHRVGALLACLLFASCAAHAETIWYVAGRNETLAAIGFLGAFTLHLGSGRRRWLALPCFAFALLSKELTLPLPLLLLLHDRYIAGVAPTWLGTLRASTKLYAGYALIAVGYLALRTAVLAAHGGSALVYPYFVAPSHPDFWGHLVRQLRTYGENLFLAETTPPFMRADQEATFVNAARSALAGLALLALVVPLRRNPRLWLGLALAFVTWLPTCVVYVSERYLMLPSFGIALAGGLLLPWAKRQEVRWGVVALLLAWIASQALMLRHKNQAIIARPQNSLVLSEHLEKLRTQVDPKQPVLFANFPADIFSAQFMEPMLRHVWKEPQASCRIVSLLPDVEDLYRVGSMTARRRDERTLDVTSNGALVMRSRWQFPWAKLRAGMRFARPRLGLEVEVVDAQPDMATALRVHLPRPITDYTVLRFTPATGKFDSFGEYIRAGRLIAITP
jgi:hypothetical protein